MTSPSFHCLACGAPLVFRAGAQQVICTYCGRAQPRQELPDELPEPELAPARPQEAERLHPVLVEPYIPPETPLAPAPRPPEKPANNWLRPLLGCLGGCLSFVAVFFLCGTLLAVANFADQGSWPREGQLLGMAALSAGSGLLVGLAVLAGIALRRK